MHKDARSNSCRLPTTPAAHIGLAHSQSQPNSNLSKCARIAPLTPLRALSEHPRTCGRSAPMQARARQARPSAHHPVHRLGSRSDRTTAPRRVVPHHRTRCTPHALPTATQNTLHGSPWLQMPLNPETSPNDEHRHLPSKTSSILQQLQTKNTVQAALLHVTTSTYTQPPCRHSHPHAAAPPTPDHSIACAGHGTSLKQPT